ncbi:DoxX family protein [Aliiruegeria sabulilitoris]|uniref:DoxX family protein n=1 Tax=Aliiruegeria sabulilitoris TaxID=1510458 RepID=UPI0008373196|nr:DoxX family protein [Aliiruegeria sabulilitoris]NDR56366.1 DoxX family protein [Pseudoruegeria sp. M32A2M]
MTDLSASAEQGSARGKALGAIISIHNAIFSRIDAALSSWAIPTLARFAFAAVLLMYFWGSAMTKLGDGIFGLFSPSVGAYAQIFPQKAEAVVYDTTQFSIFEKLLILAGTWAEFILPLLIVIGLFTRLAALGMIGFVTVQSLTDIHGHHADATTIGAWFDRASDSLIMDQRAFWMFVLITLVLRGAGPFSVDKLLGIDRQNSK